LRGLFGLFRSLVRGKSPRRGAVDGGGGDQAAGSFLQGLEWRQEAILKPRRRGGISFNPAARRARRRRRDGVGAQGFARALMVNGNPAPAAKEAVPMPVRIRTGDRLP